VKNNTARIHKAYRLIFGRAPTDAEVKAGIAFITTEPLKDYQERKDTKATKEKDTKATKEKDTKGTKDGDTKGTKNDDTKDTKDGDTKDTKDDDGKDTKKDDEKPEPSADGMMAGVIPGAAKPEDAKKLLPVTPWGRYMKILLSSSEFLFID